MACELQSYFETEVLEFLKTCTNDEFTTGHYGTRRALKRLAQSGSSITSGGTSVKSSDETFEGDEYHWTRKNRRGLTNGGGDNSSSDSEHHSGNKALRRKRYKRNGRGFSQDQGDPNMGMVVTRSRSSRQQRVCDRVGSTEIQSEEDDNESVGEESEEEVGGEGVESFEVTIPRRSMRTRSSVKMLDVEKDESKDCGEDEEDLTSEDTYLGRKRNLRTRRSVRNKEYEEDGCEDGLEEEDEEASGNAYPRRSHRKRVAVQKYGGVVEDNEEVLADESRESSVMAEEVFRTTRTGRVIKPTVRYS